MDQILQLILAVISSSAITSLAMLRSKKRTGDTESYKMLLDDLNQRLAENIKRTRDLEAENTALKKENSLLRQELDQIRAEITNLKAQITK